MIAYFDCIGGASGDMILAALVDAGLGASRLERELWAGGLEGFHLEASRVRRGAIAASLVKVVEDPPGIGEGKGKRLGQLLADISALNLSSAVKERAAAVFTRLARAEAQVHGEPPDEVELHEVGSRDCLIDVVGSLVGLELLGADEVVVSPLPLGSGTVRCRHGLLPVPAPATLELLRGVPTRGGGQAGERVTPTGAAILTTIARGFGPPPPMVPEAVGYGAGSRQDRGRLPNVLRLVLGQAAAAASPEGTPDEVCVLEANIDDMNPQLFEPAMEELFRRGALDVYLTPLLMKKGRPGVLLSVLAPAGISEALAECLLTHTTTLGVRMHYCRRRVADREFIEVDAGGGRVKVKLGKVGGQTVTVAPEYDDCRRVAQASRASVKEVHEAARARAWALARAGRSPSPSGDVPRGT
ncbi:MAG: nickel pincer cofactor biosynthesis protein LarC [Acetobacteraceae bacterium]|nr:nickel pincer cofactor biosynthesis protein LarC [Acetobacteraceae bacterium]